MITLRFIGSLLILLGSLTALHAQEEQVAPDSVPPLQPVPLTEIPELVEEANRLGTSSQELLSTPKEIAEINELLPDLATRIDSIYDVLDDTLNLTSRLIDLDSWLKNWQLTQSKIKDWNDLLTNRIILLQDKDHELEDHYEVTMLTYQEAQSEQSPRELLRTIRRSADYVETQRIALKDALADLLKIQNDLVPLNATTNKALGILENQKAEVLSNIWSPELPPIWKMKKDTSELPVGTQISNAVSDHLKAVASDWQVNHSFRYFLFLIFPFVGGYLLYFKYTAQRKYHEHLSEMDDTRVLMKFPILSAYVITWILCTLTVELNRDLSFLYAFSVTAPVAILQYNLARHFPLQQTVLFVGLMLALFLEFFMGDTFEHRFLLLFLSLFLIAFLGIVDFDRRLADFRKQLPFFLQVMIHLLIILSLLGFLVNLIGAVRLAELLTTGVVVSLLLAAVFYQSVYLSTDLGSVIMIASPLANSNIVKKHRQFIRKRLKQTMSFVAIILWIYFSMERFTVHDMVINYVVAFVTKSITFGSVSISLGDILAFFLTIQVSIWLSRFIRFILEEEVYARSSAAKKGVGGTISLLIRYAIISLGVVLAFAAAGIEFSKIAVLIGALGVGIGFGLQSIFNNLVSGIILAVERPIQIGDVIEVGGLMGTVTEIGFRASIIRTFEGSEVIVPNGDLISAQMINWTHSDSRRRLEVKVGVAYGTDPQLVLDTLRAAADSHEGVMKYPAPIPRFIAYGDSALEFQLFYWIPDFNTSFRMGTEMHKRVHEMLVEKNIEIAFPQLDLHVRDTPKEE